jgi:hypothetical protein
MLTNAEADAAIDAGPPPTADTWAIVELMGHVRLGGRLTEEERFGAKLGRLDIPNPAGGFVTQFFGGQSVYRITIVSEEAARAVAVRAPAPVSPWELPRQLKAADPRPQDDDEDLLDLGDRDSDDGPVLPL